MDLKKPVTPKPPKKIDYCLRGRLLRDIFDIYAQSPDDWISVEWGIIPALLKLEEWRKFDKGQGLTATRCVALLRDLDLKITKGYVGGWKKSGYERVDIEYTWEQEKEWANAKAGS